MPYDKKTDTFRCEYPTGDSSGSSQPCGVVCRDLARHITRHHKIKARVYKEMFGLNLNTSLISEQTKQKLREAVQKYKTYENLEKGKEHQFKKGSNSVQKYKRSEESKSRLRTLRK